MSLPPGQDRLVLGVVGYGRWGRVIVRNLLEIEGVFRVFVFVKGKVPPNHIVDPRVTFVEYYNSQFDVTFLSAAIICVPPSQHLTNATHFIRSGVPILVEKPCGRSFEETQKIIGCAKDHDVFLMVGYTQLFGDGFKKLKNFVRDSSPLTEIYSEMLSDGPVRDDISVLWDWGAHEIACSIMLERGDVPQLTVLRTERESSPPHREVVTLELIFPSGLNYRTEFGNFASRRRSVIRAVTSDASLIFDRNSRLLSIQGEGVSLKSQVMSEVTDGPLSVELRHFVRCVLHRRSTHFTSRLVLLVNKLLASVKL